MMSEKYARFREHDVYRISKADYVNNRYYKDEENMFLIDDKMVFKNKIVGEFDGAYVNPVDSHEQIEYYTIPPRMIPTPIIETKAMTDGKGIRYVEYETNLPNPIENAENEMKNSFQPEDVEATLAGVYDTDYFSSMMDIDAFLKTNS